MSSGRGLSAILLGLIFLASPIILARIPYGFSYPLIAKVAVILLGVFTLVAGFLVPGADSYGSVLDLYTVIGSALVLAGPVFNYPVGFEFWTTMSFVTAIFLGFPTVMLLHLSREES